MKTVDPVWVSCPTVLMVELDVLVRRPSRNICGSADNKVIEAGETDEALLILTSERTTIGIVLAGAQAPGKLDGFDWPVGSGKTGRA